MGAVIYSASPIQAFLGSAGTILLIFAIGLTGIGVAIFRRSQSKGSRILTGILGGFLIIVSFIVAGITLTSISSQPRAVVLKVDNKEIVEDNCGDNGETCTRYVLESTNSTTAFDFNVTRDAYDKVDLNACYKFTYYPNHGLFSSGAASYQSIDTITSIESVDQASCP